MTNHNIKPHELNMSLKKFRLKREVRHQELLIDLRSQLRGTIAVNDGQFKKEK